MSVDILQEKIRKTKCPIIMDLSVRPEHIPPHIREVASEADAYDQFCRELLNGLKGIVPAVRFSFDQWALMGGLEQLSKLLKLAADTGYYVLLDGPAALSPWAAERAATLLEEDSLYPCHAMITSPYIGNDAIQPFLAYCQKGKAVFFAVRTANKTASQLQDLMTGSRLVHIAAADAVTRLGESYYGKYGYSHVGALTAATNANAVMGLRNKYQRLFLIADGLDYPGGNGKICSYGFDKLGHGCAVSVGAEIAAAWMKEESDGTQFVTDARMAAERIRNNFTRYFSIL